MKTKRYGLQVDSPAGWYAEISRRPREAAVLASDDAVVTVEDITHPVVHLCSRQLPPERGDFGTGVVNLLTAQDVFVALVEYDSQLADQGLFAPQGMPRLAPSQFDPNRLQRPLPGRSAAQHFFSLGGRAFCLFVVLGSHARRMALVPKAVAAVAGLRVTAKQHLLQAGEELP